jgi:hypothetical protein
MGKDLNWIIGGLVAALLVPLLAFGLNLPFILAVVIAAVAFAGLVILLAPRRLFEGLDVGRFGRDKVAFATDLLTAAAPSATRLGNAAARIRAPDIRTQVEHLAGIAHDVLGKVEANPTQAPAVRRFLSFYLPQAAQVADGYAVLEAQRAPDAKRLGDVSAMIGKLEQAFIHYADSLAEADLGSLDVELRLIERSLKEDLQS